MLILTKMWASYLSTKPCFSLQKLRPLNSVRGCASPATRSAKSSRFPTGRCPLHTSGVFILSQFVVSIFPHAANWHSHHVPICLHCPYLMDVDDFSSYVLRRGSALESGSGPLTYALHPTLDLMYRLGEKSNVDQLIFCRSTNDITRCLVFIEFVFE